jgi:hypothetical protein
VKNQAKASGFVQDVEIKTWAGSHKITVSDDVNPAALLGSSTDLLAALEECRAEITRINRAAGETVFNPAVTQMVDAALAKARGE